MAMAKLKQHVQFGLLPREIGQRALRQRVLGNYRLVRQTLWAVSKLGMSDGNGVTKFVESLLDVAGDVPSDELVLCLGALRAAGYGKKSREV